MVGVVGLQGCKDLTDGAEVLIDPSLLDGIPMRGQKSGTYALDKNLEERNWVFYAFKVRVDVQPAAEALPLAPGIGVFIVYYGGEALGDLFMCSIVVICCLQSDGRGGRRQGLLYGKCVQKWERNLRPGR